MQLYNMQRWFHLSRLLSTGLSQPVLCGFATLEQGPNGPRVPVHHHTAKNRVPAIQYALKSQIREKLISASVVPGWLRSQNDGP